MKKKNQTKQNEAELVLYHPHEKQLEFHSSLARFRVAAFGRQSGKSTACLNELIFKAWINPGTTYWFISPTYDQARVQYRRTVGMLWACSDIMLKKNQTELMIKLINHSQIRFVSGESLQNLRGETLHGVVIDEVRDQDKDLWPMVVRPMLTTTKGWAAFVSTPSGFDQFYDLFERAQSGMSGWASFQAPSICNPLFTMEEYEAAQNEMSEALFAQEILAQFRDLTSGSAYKNHGLYNHRFFSPFSNKNEQVSPFLPLVIACDFNVTPISWLIGQQRNNAFYFFEEIFIEDTNTLEASIELCDRIKTLCPNGHKPGAIVIGDASGAANKTSAAGETDYSILMRALAETFGRNWASNETPASNPHVKDRVNTVNGRLKAADGSVNLWYNPQKCPHLKKDFERVVWKHGTGAILDQKKNPMLTHISDACGYAVYKLSSEIWGSNPGTLRVISK